MNSNNFIYCFNAGYLLAKYNPGIFDDVRVCQFFGLFCKGLRAGIMHRIYEQKAKAFNIELDKMNLRLTANRDVKIKVPYDLLDINTIQLN